MQFKSDFSLFPIKKLGNPGWEYRKATWPDHIDPLVHKLFDDEYNQTIPYTRKRNFDGKIQSCMIEKIDDGAIIMKPGDGYNFLVRRDSFLNCENNANDEKEIEVDNNVIPHDILCLICQENKRTHMVNCGHVICCEICAQELLKQPKKECPICRKTFIGKLKKLYF